MIKIELPKHLKGDLYLGDNLEIMKSLPSSSIDLVYIDPPFFSGRNYSTESKIDVGEIRSFDDTFKTLNDYLRFLYPRLAEMKRLLKPTGSIYVHADWHASHYVKVMMDNIYGYDNFRNEIIWHYKSSVHPKKDFQRKHDVILRYSKTDDYIYNMQYDEYSENTIKRFDQTDDKGKQYKIVTKRGEKHTVYMKDEGMPADDVWDISIVIGTSNEYFDYPTQKPEALLERIIKASSNEGDTVADFFGGSGTTAAVSQRLGRKWITCDKSEKSIEVIKARLFGNKSVKEKGYQIDVESAWS